MNPFTFTTAKDAQSALAEQGNDPQAKFLGGGTNLVDLMKMGVEKPAKLIDVHRLPLQEIAELPDGKGVRIGAMATNSAVAEHPLIQDRFAVLSEALLAGASPQLRNRATVGGNLLQKTRCYYFYDPALGACNKRTPGTGCAAVKGFNRMHAILGQSKDCIATHPSDMSVGLTTLDAVIVVQSPRGQRSIPINDFYRLPGDTPSLDTNLASDELIIAVDLPAPASGTFSHYVKMRDRASYAFALVSAGVALKIAGGRIELSRVVLGGVAHKPWRSAEAEKVLTGAAPNAETYAQAAEAALAGASGYAHNTFKIEMAKKTIIEALSTVIPLS